MLPWGTDHQTCLLISFDIGFLLQRTCEENDEMVREGGDWTLAQKSVLLRHSRQRSFRLSGETARWKSLEKYDVYPYSLS